LQFSATHVVAIFMLNLLIITVDNVMGKMNDRYLYDAAGSAGAEQLCTADKYNSVTQFSS